MMNQQIQSFERVSLLWSHVESDEYLPGMATVARELMEINNVDVVLLAVRFARDALDRNNEPSCGGGSFGKLLAKSRSAGSIFI